ncbi:MAG: sulfatase-like hydrolase/transferase [Verrucomicrobiaceae bacterium]|nr:sulfatase-like hydrolase/transferase [Verrucomicrobiaceae bacterium]NCF89981.1 sulfatase-like hydrolase/transferase [Verrucomicrobiaceae bacterium]
MRDFVAVSVFSLLISFSPKVFSQSGASERPNIVLVMADDHGYGDCGYTGHPFVKTPHLDAIAKTGVVFNRFYASSPVCSPTRAAVITGRHAFRVNVPNHGHYLRPHEVTIAEVLRDNGYVWRWHLGSGEPVMDAFPETERGWVSKIIFERGEVHAAFLNALAVAVVAMVFKEGPLWCCRYQRR